MKKWLMLIIFPVLVPLLVILQGGDKAPLLDEVIVKAAPPPLRVSPSPTLPVEKTPVLQLELPSFQTEKEAQDYLSQLAEDFKVKELIRNLNQDSASDEERRKLAQYLDLKAQILSQVFELQFNAYQEISYE